MAGPAQTADNLKSFDAHRDENGQIMGQDSPTDVARPDDLRRILDGDPSGEAQTARIASGWKSEDATAEVEAEVPAETIDKLGNPSL